jgi:pyruvate, water dikinase
MTTEHIAWLSSPDVPNVGLVGGKGRSLHVLANMGLTVPDAFIVTTSAYRAALPPLLADEIDRRISSIDAGADVGVIDETARRVRELLYAETANHAVDVQIREAYLTLAERLGMESPPVAVRSSSAAEDSAEHSFAGEHDSYLWIIGPDEVSDAVRRCWASLFTARAITYRARNDLSTSDDAMAVVIQHMVDARAAGVFMTLNPVNGDRSKIVVESVWGLGEPLVSGTATPDRFIIDKVTKEVLEQTIAVKTRRAGRDPQTGRGIALAEVDPDKHEAPSLSPAELNLLIDIARTVESRTGCPQDGEFALHADQIFLLQARPETVWSNKPRQSAPTAPNALAHVLRALTGQGAPARSD